MTFGRSSALAAALLVTAALPRSRQMQDQLSVRSSSGLRLIVAEENAEPSLHVILPGKPASYRAIHVLFPEHVTAVKRGRSNAEQLYLFRPGAQPRAPKWRRSGPSLQYERDLAGGVHLLARATVENDGVRFRYEFVNRSSTAFSMISAVTDPRLTAEFHDQRLERTYVHHSSGFDLLASETPERLTRPLAEWLPARYLASFTWPVPSTRVERRPDGIVYYNKSRSVDEPFVATLSRDGTWVIASFARAAGNVWSNPALTCQHVDPQTSLAPGQRVTLEVKLLIMRGSLDTALQRARAQRRSLK